MGLSNQQNVLVPCKFISIMLHLIVTTMNYFSYVHFHLNKKHDNILIAYPQLLSKTDVLYEGAKTSFLASNTLIIIFLAVEIVLLFLGVNLFREKLSVFGNCGFKRQCRLYISWGLFQGRRLRLRTGHLTLIGCCSSCSGI